MFSTCIRDRAHPSRSAFSTAEASPTFTLEEGSHPTFYITPEGGFGVHTQGVNGLPEPANDDSINMHLKNIMLTLREKLVYNVMHRAKIPFRPPNIL